MRQLWLLRQLFPHRPQLRSSVSTLMQSEPHRVSVHVHAPITQAPNQPQSLPQRPQW
jgi:hypothetical protein